MVPLHNIGWSPFTIACTPGRGAQPTIPHTPEGLAAGLWLGLGLRLASGLTLPLGESVGSMDGLSMPCW